MEGTADSTDILIIGAGASGSVAAKHLAEQGFRVVVLEQGSWVSTSEVPGNKPEYELLGSGRWNPDPNVRGWPADYPVNVERSEQPVYMYNTVGGGTPFYAGVWSRPLPSDFRTRTLDGVADDWPITYHDLLPYYRANDMDMGVSGLSGNPAYPDGYHPPLPAHPIHLTGRKMAEGMNKLGWHWWPGYSAIPSQAHRYQNQCVRYGVCRLGCAEGAKASTDITVLPDALKYGAQIVTGARVSRVTVNERGLADGAVYLRGGKEYFQPASVVIMAANGIGTPRLLLMSSSNLFPDGLANSSGLVGKRLMLHPFGSSIGLYEEDLEDWVGPAGIQIESMQFYETDTSRGFVRGSKWHVMGTGGPLEMVRRWTIGEGVSEENFWGEKFTAKMKQAIGHSIDWIVHAEDLPEETNVVSLDPALTDSDGLPAPKVHYTTSENTHRSLAFGLERTLEAHGAAGATRAWITHRNFSSGHNLGTAKMGDDPETSVVNRYGRTHDVPNLYVIDGSVFPTSTATNPTATICALAKRTASYIATNAGHQETA
jgi:choline dehydrogenase-like flavoprotein